MEARHVVDGSEILSYSEIQTILKRLAYVEDRLAKLEKEHPEPLTPPASEPIPPVSSTATISTTETEHNELETVAQSTIFEDAKDVVSLHESVRAEELREDYVSVVKEYDESSKEWKERKLDPNAKRSAKVTEGGVLTYRMIVGASGTDTTWEIDIEDKALLTRLRRTYEKVCPHDNIYRWNERKEKLLFPFETVVWCYDELYDFASDARISKDDPSIIDEQEDVQKLLEFVSSTPPLQDYFRQRQTSPEQIDFKYLWALFPPGTEFVSSRLFLNTPQLFRVQDTPSLPTPESLGDRTPFAVSGWCYDHTGSEWVRAVHKFQIKHFDREKPINSLEYYPVRHHADRLKLQADCTATGKRFAECCAFTGAERARKLNGTLLMLANGGSSAHQLDPGFAPGRIKWEKKTKFEGEVIVDSELGRDHYPALQLGGSTPTLYYENDDMDDLNVPLPPTDAWVRFCPPRLYGYMIKQEARVQVKVSDLGDVPDKDAKHFKDELQLAQDSKDLLLGLVESHSRKTVEGLNPKQYAGKGNSLVILLHGSPGLGKTLTAETLAKATGKPLLIAKVASIGLEAQRAETRLQAMFEKATRWDAILLMDEADAFLEARSEMQNAHDNALVTVMLRVLEYHNGIIILTTNRLFGLDPAVDSRVRVPMYFDSLSQKSLKAIFEYHLRENQVGEDAKRALSNWFDYVSTETTMNGRELRNLIYSAIDLAAYEGHALCEKDFRTVHGKLNEFRKHLDDRTRDWKAKNVGFASMSRRY